MTEDIEVTALADDLKEAIADYVAGKTDAYGFTKIGSYADHLRVVNAEEMRVYAKAIDIVVDECVDQPSSFWRIIYLLVDNTKVFSKNLGEKVIADLDATVLVPVNEEEATSRYYKFLVFMATGGRPSALRLRDEKSFRAAAPVLWYNLMITIFDGSPLSIIDLTIECINRVQLNIKDIIMRLNMYYDILGRDFNRGMIEIAESLSYDDRVYFSDKLKSRFDLTIIRHSSNVSGAFESDAAMVEFISRIVDERVTAALKGLRVPLGIKQAALDSAGGLNKLGERAAETNQIRAASHSIISTVKPLPSILADKPQRTLLRKIPSHRWDN